MSPNRTAVIRRDVCFRDHQTTAQGRELPMNVRNRGGIVAAGFRTRPSCPALFLEEGLQMDGRS